MSELVRLAAELEGPAGAPVLVLGDSLGTTRSVWDAQVPALRQYFRLLRFEHRGHGTGPAVAAGAAAGRDPAAAAAGDQGRSPAPAGPYTVDELGRDVLALLDSRGLGRVLYCGISLGGMVGMWLAATAPARIAGLGLCCTSAFLPPAAGWAARAAQVRSAGMSSVVEQVADRWFTPAFRASDPATVHAFRIALEGTSAEGYAGCCEAIGAMDLRPSLASICAPTLVISGADDPATPPGHGAVIASGISTARLRVIRGAAHLANVSAAGEVTAALLPHLRSAAQFST